MHADPGLHLPLAHDAPAPVDPAKPALILLCASVFELIAAVVLCSDWVCTGLVAYAVSAGAVSAFFALVVLVCLRYDDAVPAPMVDLVPLMSAFLFVWWLPAWLALTFVGPFPGLCNGFFASWAALVASLWLLRLQQPVVDGFVSRFLEVARFDSAEELRQGITVERARALGTAK